MRKRIINMFLVWLSALLYLGTSMCWLAGIIGNALTQRPLDDSFWVAQVSVAVSMASLYTWLFTWLSQAKYRKATSTPSTPNTQTLSPLFQDRRVMWLTLASIASLILVIGKAITHQPSWLAIALYSVVLPSAWLAAGALFTKAAKGIAQDQAISQERYQDDSPTESLAVSLAEEVPVAPVTVPLGEPAQVSLHRS